MKTEVIIKNGRAKILLRPENSFEKSLIKDAYDDDYDKKVYLVYQTRFSGDYDHEIEIQLNKQDDETTKED